MPRPPWNESYASGQLPWDTGQPDPLLTEFVTSGGVLPSRTLEIGAGTGTNAIWMAEHGFDVLGVDVSPLAVERAHAKTEGRALRCRFATSDFLAAPPPDGPFQFVFDRGCFHVFDEPDERQQFAAQVAAALAPGGLWLSLIGSSEGPARYGRSQKSKITSCDFGYRFGYRHQFALISASYAKLQMGMGLVSSLITLTFPYL